jgi:hypothetical protein
MKKISTLSLIIIVAFSVILTMGGCAQPTSFAEIPPQLPIQNKERPDQYTNAQYGFTFKVCNDREFEFTENQAGATVTLIGPILRDFKHRIGIYVILNELPPKTSLEDYLKRQQATARANLKNFTLIDETDIIIADIPAKLSHATFTVGADDEGINYKTALVAFVKNGVVYAIQYETDTELYDEYSGCFNTILSTFRFN